MSETTMTTSPCTGCGVPVARRVNLGRPPRYCPDCKIDRRRIQIRDYCRRVRAGIPIASTFVCIDCREEFPRPSGMGPRPERCSPCYATYVAGTRKAWVADNPERRREIARKGEQVRRARIAAATVEDFTDLEIFERDRWRCRLCRKAVNKNLRHPDPLSPSLDHILPLALGGDHSRANTQLAHLGCNVKKNLNAVGEQMLLFG